MRDLDTFTFRGTSRNVNALPNRRSDDDLQLDVADLDDVVGGEGALLTGIDARAIDVSAVGAVEVFER